MFWRSGEWGGEEMVSGRTDFKPAMEMAPNCFVSRQVFFCLEFFHSMSLPVGSGSKVGEGIKLQSTPVPGPGRIHKSLRTYPVWSGLSNLTSLSIHPSLLGLGRSLPCWIISGYKIEISGKVPFFALKLWDLAQKSP